MILPAFFWKNDSRKGEPKRMNISTTNTQTPGIETTPGDLAAILHNDTGENVVYIAERREDWNTLTNAGIPALYCTQDTTGQLISMLRGKPTRKTVTVWSDPQTVPQWYSIIKTAREDTHTTVKLLPAGIRKTMEELRNNPYSDHAHKWEKAIRAYADHEEEQANPQPGNVLEYLTHGKYTEDIEKFKKGAEVRTGFPALDQKIGGGLYAGLYVLGAVPSLGKTTYALQLADQIAEQKKHVLFFSMEQSRLELVSKSITRISRQQNPSNQNNLKPSLFIRMGYTSTEIEQALKRYTGTIAPYMNIIEGNFSTTVNEIRQTVEKYIERNNVHPVVIIDYLQILQPVKESKATDPRTLTDQNIKALKILSRDLETPVIAISSFNRNNYKQTVDYESFKETSGIEYTADVLLGMEYEVISTLDGKNPNTDRERVNQAKGATVREIKLKCLKNRYGKADFKIKMNYFPRYDYFQENEPVRKFSFDE